ncbi:MAG TPA: DUF1232 domain-containing protein [Anaerolineales bacterium]|nr:DUF1232 domain-containing protein [Anaerolineales bacterium]
MFEQLRARARALKTEAVSIFIAARDPRTPWYVRVLIFFVVAHTFSPIDLIPDFIPILGYLDDLLITPAGIWLAVRLTPPEVMADARAKAALRGEEKSMAMIGAVLIVAVWVAVFVSISYLIFSS